jgi:hypothetical protein
MHIAHMISTLSWQYSQCFLYVYSNTVWYFIRSEFSVLYLAPSRTGLRRYGYLYIRVYIYIYIYVCVYICGVSLAMHAVGIGKAKPRPFPSVFDVLSSLFALVRDSIWRRRSDVLQRQRSVPFRCVYLIATSTSVIISVIIPLTITIWSLYLRMRQTGTVSISMFTLLQIATLDVSV